MNSPYVSIEKREKRGLANYGISVDRLKMLEDFVELVKFNYNILNVSSLKFFKDWLVNDLNAQIPKSRFNRPVPKPEDNQYRKEFAKAARKGRGESESEPSGSESECDDYEDKITHTHDPDFKQRKEFEDVEEGKGNDVKPDCDRQSTSKQSRPEENKATEPSTKQSASKDIKESESSSNKESFVEEGKTDKIDKEVAHNNNNNDDNKKVSDDGDLVAATNDSTQKTGNNHDKSTKEEQTKQIEKGTSLGIEEQ